MNERIQELVEQAGFYVTEKNGAALTEFAKCIIRDCVVGMNEMPRYFRETQHRTIEEATIEDCIMTIKTRFGVE